jgi:hypothetical protein
MFEHRSSNSRVIFINEPFLLTRFQSPNVDKRNSERKGDIPGDMFMTHKLPKILALGVMLLEMELGRLIKEFKRPDSRESDGINATHLAACSALDGKRLWPHKEIFTPIKESPKSVSSLTLPSSAKIRGKCETSLTSMWCTNLRRSCKYYGQPL